MDSHTPVKSKKPICRHCGSITFSKDDVGFLNCNNCHMRLESFISQEVEAEIGGAAVRTTRVKKPGDTDTQPFKTIQKDNRYHILQTLLQLQATSLIKQMQFNKQLYQVVGELWHSYLLSLKAGENAKQLKSKPSAASSSSSSSVGATDKDKEKEKEKEKQGDSDSDSDEDEDEDGVNNIKEVRRMKSRPSPLLTLGICFLSLTWIKEPIMICDLLRLVHTGQIPIKLSNHQPKWTNFNNYNYKLLYSTCKNLSEYLNFEPEMNMALILTRICSQLGLPKSILVLAIHIYTIVKIPFELAKKPINRKKKILDNYLSLFMSYNSDVLASSLILFCINIKYNLETNLEESSYPDFLQKSISTSSNKKKDSMDLDDSSSSDDSSSDSESEEDDSDEDKKEEDYGIRVFLTDQVQDIKDSNKKKEKTTQEEEEPFKFEKWLYSVIDMVQSNNYLQNGSLWNFSHEDLRKKPINDTHQRDKSYLQTFISDKYQIYKNGIQQQQQDTNNNNSNSTTTSPTNQDKQFEKKIFSDYFNNIVLNSNVKVDNNNQFEYKSFGKNFKSNYNSVLCQIFESIIGCSQRDITLMIQEIEKIYLIYSKKYIESKKNNTPFQLIAKDFQ
ncbi:inositol 5-phosphatase 2 [Cavenderia fasciculata]|uniref:Inositol 5-phosphatase 2 n=1 Tax=Cavenderia fasciculata TaxID=261658 RepID=F4PL85_CACFS|nr:inositol 5-phosphatase 2 [Cavenderia fasciculata]EGG23307.1 inositol 5-phosphatase 2 [Cavenderia fasciculata]|eukprot:XP_004361158.1 inositol 5-phosphatase 2 [Cavenderia fasciculata]